MTYEQCRPHKQTAHATERVLFAAQLCSTRMNASLAYLLLAPAWPSRAAGVCCFSHVANFLTEATGFSETFKGVLSEA